MTRNISRIGQWLRAVADEDPTAATRFRDRVDVALEPS
jgi:hypothetical protein